MATKTNTKTEVATTQNAGAMAVPDFMKGQAGAGLESLNAQDIETPRIKLIQSSSPEVEEYDDAKPGVFWHTGINASLGKSLEVVAVFFEKRALLWRPRHDGGGILARSNDLKTWSAPGSEFTVKPLKDNPKTVVWKIPTNGSVQASGLLEWGSSIPGDANSKPAATLMYNYVLAVPDDLDIPPGVLTLQNSGSRMAKKLNQKLKLARAPIYGIKLLMESFQESNSEGQKFYNVKFSPAGFVQNEELFLFLQSSHEALRDMGLKMADVENEDEDEERTSAEGDSSMAESKGF